MVQPRSLIPDGLQDLAGSDLPRLADVEFVLDGPGLRREPGRTLAHEILNAEIWD